MPVDLIYQQGPGVLASTGDVGTALLESNLDPMALRPWRERAPNGRLTGRNLVGVFNGLDAKGKPQYRTVVTNAPATLMYDQWKMFDDVTVRQQRLRLRVWGDLVNQGLQKTIPNGLSVMVLIHQTMTDAGEATISMDPLRQSNRDRPLYDTGGMPLPVIHSDFHFSIREILASQRQGIPLDDGMVENSVRKCLEQVEKLALGTAASYSYGGYTVYGMTNHPGRRATTLTLPTSAGWGPETFVNEILDAISSLQDDGFDGPYGIWYSADWMKYMGADYSATYSGTLRKRLADIDTDESDILFWHKTRYLTGFRVLIAQLTSDVIQAVNGMRLQPVQWDSHGGWQRNFKIIGMMLPRVRANTAARVGVNDCVAA
jgi:hypothetical protein